ncbi:MAG: T9SS type A sorting domain-containing protein [Reichenbachiella sp.]|uniref:T9SS type A sorting domain-containing protein n=1 Tax=Reichenbachiella sp. TaxID=2184521 RepID=UPI002966195E|nr:T9SS type A sorting domain-containing protein [Reichenbachiella sp.]MDW3211998.1 T9SS type A sorting domain-containing protein [Reichenbachiella sp.]
MKKIIQLKRVVPLIWIALLGFSYHATAQIADVTSQLNTWQTFDFVEGVQTGEFTFEFDMTAEKVNIDAVTGLTNVAAVSTYSDMSVIVRFNSSGMIDAYDGSGYASENDLTYSAGTTYAVRVEVDASTMSYDVYVTPDGGSEITIADGYTFRNKVINLTGMAVVNGDFNVADPGNHDTENIVLTHISENTDPVFVQLDEQNVNEGSDLEVTVEAVDPLDAAITLTQSGLPGFGTFMDNGDNTATISVSPEVGDLGQYTITVTATSTTGTNTQDVVINVNEYSEIFTIESEPEDIDLYYHVDTRNPAVLNWGGTEMLVGGGVNWQDAADEYDMAAVMPFQIPEIPQGSNSFKSATFSANVNYVVTWAYVDYDLYGLDYRDEPTVLGTDYYQGVYDGDENATAIQQKWAATSGPTSQTVEPGVVATTIEGGESLTDYLNAQLQAGAEPGDYVFLRVNVNVANATTYARIDIDSHESDNPPVLDVTFYQPLILDPIGDHVVTRDEETTIDLNATFAEADPMVFSVEGEPAFVALTDNNDGTAVLTLTPDVDDLGNHRDIVVTVTAGEYTYEETITLTVTEAPNAIYVDAADSYTVFGEAYDPAEAFVWSGAPEILTGGSYVDADAVDHAAVMPFEIPAIPDGMVIATATLELTTNQVPAWMPHSNDLTALPYRDAATVLGTDHYSGPYGGDPSAYPIQEDFITPTTAVGLTNTSEKGNEAIVQYLNEQLAAGAEAGDFVFFRLNADQETKLTDWARVDINSHESSSNTGGAYLTVTLMPNNAPVIDAIVDQTMLERRSLEVDVTGSDADGDPLLFNLAAGTPSFIAITDNGDGTAKVTISPTVDDTGEITVEVEATDGLEKSTQSFTLTVNASNLPVLAAIADQSVREGLSETVALSATDADVDDVLTLTLSGAPDFVVLTDNGDGTGSLAIDPMVGDEGTYADISVSVSDGFDDVEQSFTLTVSANAAPVLAGIGNQTMTSERTHSIAISATDADSDDLAFSIASEHAFVTLVDNGDGTGSIEVDGADVSPDDYENIVVSVTDSNESVSETIKITMVQNSLPSLTAIGDQTAVIDETTEVALAASDDDASDQLVFSISDNAPSFVKLTDNGDGTGKLTMTPAAADLGEHKDIVVKVSDGLGQAIETIMVTVEEATVTSVSHLQNEMAVFPNPTVNGIVNVQIPAELNGGKLSLFGITGKLMQQVQLSDTASKQPYQLTINRSVPKGQYVMILSNASLTVTKRLVIQ